MNILLNEELTELIRTEKEKCTGCRKCMKNCPMLKSFCSTPRQLLEDIHTNKEADMKLAYSCALCGYCRQVCPESVDLKAVFYALRKASVEQYKKVPKAAGAKPVLMHQKYTFTPLLTADNIMKISRQNDSNKNKEIIKTKENKSIKSEGEAAENNCGIQDPVRVFFPGCSLMSYSPDIVMRIYDYLKEKLPGISIMQSCCAKPVHALGDMKTFENYYEKVQSSFDMHSVDEVITACPNCFNMITKYSKEQKVISLWEIMAEKGLPKDSINRAEHIGHTFTLHDPCPTRKNPEIHDYVRKIISDLGLNTAEMKFSREKTLCCGAGGMLTATNNELAFAHMEKRAQQAENEHIVTYCQECTESMKKGGKKALHLLDFLFNEGMYQTKIFDQQQTSTAGKWINRYKAARMIDSLR